MNTDTITNIENLIIDDRLEEAIEALMQVFRAKNDEDMLNETILVLSRLKNFLRKSNSGVIQEFDSEYAKIRSAVLNLKSSAKKILAAEPSTELSPSPTEEVSVSHPTESKVDQVIFEDHFRNNENNWSDESDNDYDAHIKNGRYFLEHYRNEGCWFFYNHIPINEENNFTISTKITFIEGTNVHGYGLIWGYTNPDNYFSFIISANRQFKYFYYIDGKYIEVAEWTKNSAIKANTNANLIEIIKKNDVLHFKVNNEVIYTSDFQSFFGDNVGFVLNENMKVAVDYIKIKN